MNQLVLSDAKPLVLSGAVATCYQAHRIGLSRCRHSVFEPPNCTNKESYGFLANKHNYLAVCITHFVQGEAS